MTAVSFPPTSEAKDVFKRLGYSVNGDATSFTATRRWREVDVVVLDRHEATSPDPKLVADTEPSLRCFVTWEDNAEELQQHLIDYKPPYDWAVIGVTEDGSHSVIEGRPESR